MMVFHPILRQVLKKGGIAEEEKNIFASLEKQEKSVKVAIEAHEKRAGNLKAELNEITTDPVEDAKTCDIDDENLKIDSLERQSQSRLFEKNTFVSENKGDVMLYRSTCAFSGLWKHDPRCLSGDIVDLLTTSCCNYINII